MLKCIILSFQGGIPDPSSQSANTAQESKQVNGGVSRPWWHMGSVATSTSAHKVLLLLLSGFMVIVSLRALWR